MKRMKLIYTLLLAVTLPLLTACYNDEAVKIDDEPIQQGGKITVHLRVSQAAPTTTRAWVDKDNATDDEMMNVWTVVAVNNNDGDDDENKVVGIWSCKPSKEPDREIDEIDAELPSAGSYRFYSFANMSPQKVMELLKITSSTTSTDSKVLASGFLSVENDKVVEIAFNDGATVDADYNIAVNVKGNGFDPTKENDFDANGIPMSNVQTFDLKEGDKKDLIVIRMLAKIKLQIKNERGSALTINSIKLTNITANPTQDTGEENLMLLPNLKIGHNTMESNDGYHGDITPNLNGTPVQTEVEMLTTSVEIAEDKSTEIVFYVNESDVRKQPTRAAEDAPDFYHFFLEIAVDGDNYVGDKEARYVMIDDKGETSADDKKWDYIARNDYRIIPIVLDDYKLDMIPYDFPAIGVYPASVKEEDNIYTINFHDYGHFHLVPQVTKYSDGKTVPYIDQQGTETTYWTLVKDNLGKEDFSLSWSSWTDASKQTEYKNEENSGILPFYRNQTDAQDGDEAGGVPVWYKNNEAPKWSADGKTYPPFIFGYITNPGEELAADRKVYHEFSILLHKAGDSDDAKRVMTYRLYMILDSDQMMYPATTSRTSSAPRCSHHWH